MNTKHRVMNFWKYFKGVQGEIEDALAHNKEEEKQELLRELNLQVESVCDAKAELDYHDGFYELTFHGGANKTKQYLCALLKQQAPKELVQDWIINSYRQPLSETALAMVVKLEDKEYSGADFTVYYEIDEQAKCIHVKIYSEALSSFDQDKKQNIAIAMLELFIGEIELEARIGDVEILDAPDTEAENFCLLPNFYEDLCDIVIDKDWSEYREPCAIYSAYKLDKEIVSETLRKDMKLIVSTNPQLQEELLNHELDSCNEALRFGSVYGYLFYEIEQQGEEIAIVRQQLEKEINELFYPMAIARTIGGAIGTHYAYVDLIIFDIDAFEIILERLNEHLPFKVYYRQFQA